jgi:heme exporter protein D
VGARAGTPHRVAESLTMQWNSFSEFVDMGGYGLYVWGSYGLTLLLMLVEPVLAGRRHRHAVAGAGQESTR